MKRRDIATLASGLAVKAWQRAETRDALRKGGSVLLAASAVAAAAWYDIGHRHVTRALLPESRVKIEHLSDLRLDKDAMQAIERGLVAEWGPFGFVGFEHLEDLAAKAGESIFIALETEDGHDYVARAALQTTRVDVHGDPSLLRETYPSFHELTGEAAWKRARSKGGDTAILLQIAVLDGGQRNAGLGSTLRNAALHMLPHDVKFALTMTPLDRPPADSFKAVPALDLSDPSTFTPAMKFHARGGAEPTIVLPGYKAPVSGDRDPKHGKDIVVMRYARNQDGDWPAPHPEMRLHSLGPFEERLLGTVRRLRQVSYRGRLRSLAALRRRHAS